MSREKILLVDDNENFLRFTAELLESETYGYDVDLCFDSKCAIRMIREDKEFDYVVLDLLISGEKGDDLAEFFRKEIPHCKIIMMSGSPNTHVFENLKARKVIDAAIKKPFSVRDLIATLNSIGRSDRPVDSQ
jgi:CheY-like chemotaxis protein